MRTFLLFSAFLLVVSTATAQERATTTAGTRLLIYPTGTWTYDDGSKPGRWDLEENWYRLKKKMTVEQVRKLIGEPYRISETDVPTIIFWHYPKGGRVEINLKEVKGDSVRATRKKGAHAWLLPDWNASSDSGLALAAERARTAKGKTILIYNDRTWKPASTAINGSSSHPLNWRSLRGRMTTAQVKKLLGAPEREEKKEKDPVVVWHYPNGGRVQLMTRAVSGVPAGLAAWTEPKW